MDVDDDEIELPTSSTTRGERKRFEVKKVSFYYKISHILALL